MGDLCKTGLFRFPPPIHTDDPGSPPRSILLNPYGYLSYRMNGTTAEGSTRDGKTVLVTFWPASLPRVSCFTIYCPDLKPSALGCFPKVLYSEDGLVLLRVPICRREEDSLLAKNKHYFVYQADTENMQPSLKLITIPPDLKFSDREVALLRCREQDMFYLALLRRVIGVIDRQYYDRRFDLHLYNSKTGRWNTESMHVDAQNFNYSYTSTVLAMGGELGSVGWVDLWRGILICDLFQDNHSLRYIPLPLPLVPKPLTGNPMFFRNIIVFEDYIKFFEMHYVRPGSKTGHTCDTEGLVAATKKMKISDISSGNNNWEEDYTINFSEIPVDSPKFSQKLLNRKEVSVTKLTLKRLLAGRPALSLHDADVVYVTHAPDPNKDKASVIAVDMRNKTLKDVADFCSGRPLGYAFTYLPSGISKHLNNSRNISGKNDHASLKIKGRGRDQVQLNSEHGTNKTWPSSTKDTCLH